eukprot:evm.model.scf_2548.1 EVM.evm.TU.scf_2548.1   scf_2548:4774-8621(-)
MTAIRFCCFGSRMNVKTQRHGRGYVPKPDEINPQRREGYEPGLSRAPLRPQVDGDLEDFVKVMDGEEFGKVVDSDQGEGQSVACATGSFSGASARRLSGWFRRGKDLDMVGDKRGASSMSTEPLIDTFSVEAEESGDDSDSGAENDNGSHTTCESYGGWGRARTPPMGVSRPKSNQSRFLIVDTQSSHSHTEQASRASHVSRASRFVGLDTQSSTTTVSSVDVLPRPEVSAQSFTDLMEVASKWTSEHGSTFTWDDTVEPVASRFVQVGKDLKSGDSDMPDSADSPLMPDSSDNPLMPVHHTNQATELQDAINLVLTGKDENGAAKLGAGILAALKDMRSSRGMSDAGRPPKPQRCQPKPVHISDDPPQEMVREAPLPSSSFNGQQNELGVWFYNPLQNESGDETERGRSLGASIILPVAQHNDMLDSQTFANAAVDALAVGKNVLLQLEQSGQCARQYPESLSFVPEIRDLMRECEAAGDTPMSECTAGTSAKSSRSPCEEPPAVQCADACHSDGAGSTCGSDQDIALEKKAVDCARGNGQKDKRFHDSAITLGGCVGGTKGYSFISQLTEERGVSWASSVASSSICLLPYYPQGEAESDSLTQGTLPQTADSALVTKEAELECANSDEFHDCLPDNLQEGVADSSQAGSGAAHNCEIPDLQLDKVVSTSSLEDQDPNSLLALAAKKWPHLLEMTPRSLERWQLDLKLLWIGEEDDDLVAEVRHGSSCIMGKPTMPPVSEEDEAGGGKGSRAMSPINSPVSSPIQTRSKSCCLNDDAIRACNLAVDVEEDSREDPMDGVEGQEQNISPAIEAVNRVLQELKNGTPRKGKNVSFDDGSSETGAEREVVSADSLMSMKKNRKRSVLEGVKAQLQKLTHLLASSGPLSLPAGTEEDSNGRAELEWAILDDVRREVERLELEMGGAGDSKQTLDSAFRIPVTMAKPTSPTNRNRGVMKSSSSQLQRRRSGSNPRMPSRPHTRSGVPKRATARCDWSIREKGDLCGDRTSVFDGLRVAQKALSHKVDRLKSAPLPSREPVADVCTMPEMPPPLPPMLSRKGTVVLEVVREALQSSRGNLQSSRGNRKPVRAKEGVPGSGGIRRLFLTL